MNNNSLKELTKNVDIFHGQLPLKVRDWLKDQRGLSDDVINRFNIGWNGSALTIPIYNREGEYCFLKFRRDPRSNGDGAKYWYSQGSSAELYGWEHISNPKAMLVICEGEFDRLILETNGIPAVTSTGGANTFKKEWIEELASLSSDLYICYDNDDAGMTGANNVAKLLPRAKIIMIPRRDKIKDVTDYITIDGAMAFKDLLKDAKTLDKIEEEFNKIRTNIRKSEFPPLSKDQLLQALGVTIKQDDNNKLIAFLCQLAAYTENSQFNISFNAPSSTGKSYIPMEVSSLFPEEDVLAVGYCSPTAFFHDASVRNTDGQYVVDLSRKILIFLDQPHTLLLQHLRPLLSHDKKVISIKITDKQKNIGMRTKNILIKGFPSVIFCTAGLRVDEQEATRFLLLSPEITQEKIRASVSEKLRKESDAVSYKKYLEDNPIRAALKERIKAIKDERIEEVKIEQSQVLGDYFLGSQTWLRPRAMRDIARITSFAKIFAILNVWHRKKEGGVVVANEGDINAAILLWDEISESQQLNLPPYTFDIYQNIILPYFRESPNRPGMTRQDIIRRHYSLTKRPLADWQLRREILHMLEMAGLIVQEPDPDDRRRTLIYLAQKSESVQSENKAD